MLSKDINFKIIGLGIIFLFGLYYYVKNGYHDNKEGLTTIDGKLRCPNILIQKGSKYYLYNSNIAQVPGVNPIQFNTLEEYTEFLEWQRRVGIRCPVLYVQNTYDIQGERVYKIRPSVCEVQGGLPPSIQNNSSNDYDSTNTSMTNDKYYNQYNRDNHDDNDNINIRDTGNNRDNVYNNGYIPVPPPQLPVVESPLEDPNKNMLYSDNPMDSNWGGADYTQKLVDAGAYKDNEVATRINKL